MNEIDRQLLNVRVIGTTFRVAAAGHPTQVGAAIRQARKLLAEATADATSLDVHDAIATVEAEVNAADHTVSRREA